MKNLIFSACIIACMTLVSCKKEVVERENTDIKIENEKPSDGVFSEQGSTVNKPSMLTLYIAYDSNHKIVDVRCFGVYGGCAHTVWVYGINFDTSLLIIDSKNDDNIRTDFTDNETYLDGLFGASIVDEVISGNYTVRNLGVFDNDGDNVAYIQFFDSNDNLVKTCPIALDN